MRMSRAGGWRRAGVAVVMAFACLAPSLPLQAAMPWPASGLLAGNQLQSSLSDPANETVVRLHAWMQERMLKEGQPVPPAPVVVRVWVAANGKVERVAFDSLGNAQADADLRALLTAQPLAEAPPRDMRQPMVLQLTLSFVTNT